MVEILMAGHSSGVVDQLVRLQERWPLDILLIEKWRIRANGSTRVSVRRAAAQGDPGPTQEEPQCPRWPSTNTADLLRLRVLHAS